MTARCFLSHSWSDGGHCFALRLKSALEARGVRIWLDESDIHAGQDLRHRMISGVRECDVFLFVLSPDSVASENCLIELRTALKCRDEVGLQITPILLKVCKVPSELKDILYVDFSNEQRFDKAIEELLPGIADASRVRQRVADLVASDAESRKTAAQALGEEDNPFTVPILRRCLCSSNREPNGDVRYWLAIALGEIGTEDACAALRAALDREKDPFALLGIEEGLNRACYS